ncbi:hypothetical protein F132_22 [Flavobacterium sp. phage 1/32]|nr:hypothetical protein F132_22 [Flavobacterium sp. phage 1/32]
MGFLAIIFLFIVGVVLFFGGIYLGFKMLKKLIDKI